jgi:hypothetical protein
MEQVALLTEQQAETLAGKEYAIASYYNPVKDCDGIWLITIQEIEQTTNPDFLWVKELPLTDWCPAPLNVSGDTSNSFIS